MRILTTILTAAINRGVESVRAGGTPLSHAVYAGRHVGIYVLNTVAVWRIGADGDWQPASPLIDADLKIKWRNAVEGARVEGDAALLKAVSDFYRAVDWQVIITDAAGPFLAPRLLYIVDSVTDALVEYGRQATVDAAMIREHGERVERLRRAVDTLADRMANMEAVK